MYASLCEYPFGIEKACQIIYKPFIQVDINNNIIATNDVTFIFKSILSDIKNTVTAFKVKILVYSIGMSALFILPLAKVPNLPLVGKILSREIQSFSSDRPTAPLS